MLLGGNQGSASCVLKSDDGVGMGVGGRGGFPWQLALEGMGGEMADSKLLGCAPASEPCLRASAYVLCI